MTDPADLAARLAANEAAFKAAPSERTFDNELPEDGTYQAIFKRIDSFEAVNTTGALYLKWVFEIDSSDTKYAGKEVEKIYCLEPATENPELTEEQVQQRLGFLKQDVRRFGREVDSLSEVIPGAPLYDEILDSPVELAVVTSKNVSKKTGLPFRNVYLNEVHGGPIKSDVTPQSAIDEVASSPAATKATDDIPF